MEDVRTYLSNHFYPDWSWRVAPVWLYGPRQNLLSLWQFSWHLQDLNITHPQSSCPLVSTEVTQSFGLEVFWSIWMLSLQVFYGELLPPFIFHFLHKMCVLGRCFAVRFSSLGCIQMLDFCQPPVSAAGSLWARCGCLQERLSGTSAFHGSWPVLTVLE